MLKTFLFVVRSGWNISFKTACPWGVHTYAKSRNPLRNGGVRTNTHTLGNYNIDVCRSKLRRIIQSDLRSTTDDKKMHMLVKILHLCNRAFLMGFFFTHDLCNSENLRIQDCNFNSEKFPRSRNADYWH